MQGDAESACGRADITIRDTETSFLGFKRKPVYNCGIYFSTDKEERDLLVWFSVLEDSNLIDLTINVS